MFKKKIQAGTFILLAVAMLLSACSAEKTPPAAPTGDANAVYTQAAATVSAGLTQAAAKNPTATPTLAPPTSTPTAINAQPSPTVAQPGPGDGTPTVTVTPSTGSNLQATATSAGATKVPTATKAAGAPPAVADKALWVSQSPPDKTKVQVSSTFNMTFVLKNVGKTTWTKQYSLRYYAGPMSSPNSINLTKEVAPGESVEITFELVAPDTASEYNNIWVLSTDQGVNFSVVTLDLITTN